MVHVLGIRSNLILIVFIIENHRTVLGEPSMSPCNFPQCPHEPSEAESKEKNGAYDPMPELTVTSPYVDSRVDRLQHMTMGNPMPESTLTLCQRRLYPPARDLGFGLSPPTREYWII